VTNNKVDGGINSDMLVCLAAILWRSYTLNNSYLNYLSYVKDAKVPCICILFKNNALTQTRSHTTKAKYKYCK
jgi:hypothetical protein